MAKQYDCVIAGAGFAGAVAARELAERGGKRVLVLERRGHVGGNAYDCMDEKGIFIHKYGPHIFHTNNERVFQWLSRFTEWRDYQHEVVGNIFGQLMPIPFNLNSLYVAFPEDKAERLEKKLINTYGMESKVTILTLRENPDPDLSELADYVYEHVFVHYTEKQWGTKPEEIDPSVTAWVPVFISRDNRYFQDAYQGMPKEGYTALFSRILNHPNIEVCLDTDALDRVSLTEDGVVVDGMPFAGPVIYTGAVDELFGYVYGRLPYRTLDFVFETHDVEWYQTHGTINYTVDRPYTRITEFKHLTGQEVPHRTGIVKEYSRAYEGKSGEIPYYAILNSENCGVYDQYRALADLYGNFYLLGRLAEYAYYNMDAIVERSLALADRLMEEAETAPEA